MPQSGEIDRDGPQPRFGEAAQHRKPDPTPVRSVQQQHSRTVLLDGQVAGRFTVDLDFGPDHPRVRDFTHETTVTEHRSTCQ